MRDYIKVWTTIIHDNDPSPTAPDRAGFFEASVGKPKTADDWLETYRLFGGYTDLQVTLDGFRWYGFNKATLIEALNSSYFVGANYELFINGSQSLYEEKSGHLDIYIASPRQIGYNSEVEES